MKRLFIRIGVIVAVVAGLSACGEADRTTYDGPEYVMFSDSLSYFPVQNSDDWYNIPVASTVAYDYDRTYAVEVEDKNSNAVENKHYVFESNTVTIKAGERSANLRMKGIYENIGDTDSLAVSLRLVAKEGVQWGLYGTKTRVQIMKVCPFDLNVFTGYCKLNSTYFRDYMTATSLRVLKSDIVAGEENTIAVHDFFYSGYDLKIKFDQKKPLEPFIEWEDQVIGSTAEAFGTIHGNGKLMVTQPTVYVSYYNVCQKFMLMYITLYVKDVGTVGTYVNILEWISDEEAQQLINAGN